MSADRFELTDAGHDFHINGHDISEYPNSTVRKAIRQQARDIKLLTQMLHDQRLVIDDLEHRRVKVCDENDQLRTNLAAAIAERDDYRAEFGGLCLTLSVGSEGRPEMTAADWRKRVDQGIDFLTRPILSRIEATDKELAKRSSMLDICTQNCSDWIGKWRSEQERAEQAEAHIAAIDEAPTVAVVSECAAGLYVHQKLFGAQLAEPGAELIYRPAKD